MEKNTILYICGWHSVLFAAFHAFFWKLLNWPAELKTMGRNNRAVMQILNLRIIYIFLFAAFLCFFFTKDLYTTPLGKVFMYGMSVFWLGRTVEQFIFLRFNHWVMYVLTVFFITGIVIFLLPVFG